VQGVRRIAPDRAQIESFEDAEHLQCSDALPVGRKLVDVVAAVIDRDRLDPRRGVLFEVDLAQQPPSARMKASRRVGDASPR
jgi:hypothetical protein